MKAHVLKISFSAQGRDEALYPVILRSNNNTFLVDCGYPGFLPLLEQAAEQRGVSFAELNGVIITHHDLDHMGALAELKAKYPQVKVYTSALEAPYVSGKEKSLRLQQAEQLYPHLAEDQKAGAMAFQKLLQDLIPVTVDRTFSPEEEPPYLEGVKIVHTPGHMPGHISLYLQDSKTLLAADALVYEAGRLEIANPAYTLNLEEAVKSVQKLQQYEINTLVCYHGGVVVGNIQDKLHALLTRYRRAAS